MTLTLESPLRAATVRVVRTVADYRALLDSARSSGQTVGFVPTMGALHAGHRSLIASAADRCDLVAVSIFVNPLQFGDPTDIAAYPRTLGADVALASDAGAQVVFAPSVDEMYPGFPAPVATSVSVAGLADRWEGASRPGHFDGVATVVAKLFGMTGACRAYFGEKDAQQLAVVRKMVADLSIPVDVVACPTVRDEDGLALSSRNVRLSADERRAASVLPRALLGGAELVAAGLAGGSLRPGAVGARMESILAEEPLVDTDYAVLVRAVDLEPAGPDDTDVDLRLLVAARVGPVRLIDNLDPRSPLSGAGPL